MARPASTQPTDGELEILKILWESGPAELKTIRDRLQKQRKVATTTVATVLSVMLDKGLVTRVTGKRGHRWSAMLSRQTAARGMLGQLVDRLFDGSASLLVTHMIEAGELSDREQQQIASLLKGAKPSDATAMDHPRD